MSAAQTADNIQNPWPPALALVLGHISDQDLRERARATLLRQALDLLVEPCGDREALAIFDDHDECGLPAVVSIEWLTRRGVPITDIASPLAVRTARALFLPGGRYVPNELGSFVYVFGIIGERGLIDVAAWSPATGQIATRLGVGAALGEGQLGIDGMGTTGRPLPVWRDPVGWLRAGRCGVVIADATIAGHVFAGANLTAEDQVHADEVSVALRLPPPKVIFQTRRIAA